MPLLKGRFMSPIRPLKNVDPNETIYTISHTKEQFRSKGEYTKRLSLYEESIWTCQATGQIKLTHEEAWQSEKKILKFLQEEFDSSYEKAVLEIVHHSTDVLDTLTDQAWRKLHGEFIVGEPVDLSIKSQGKTVKGTIAKVEKTEQAADTSNCGSPSSNKENSEENKGKKTQASPSKESPRKFVFPKFLPYKYSIKLDGQDKIVNGIPAAEIVRTGRVPSKDLVKTFIRSHACRGGFQFNSPWLVKEELVQKFNLPSKFADFFVSPTKMAELGRKAMEEAAKNCKRKRSTPAKSPAAKKLKKEKSTDCD